MVLGFEAQFGIGRDKVGIGKVLRIVVGMALGIVVGMVLGNLVAMALGIVVGSLGIVAPNSYS